MQLVASSLDGSVDVSFNLQAKEATDCSVYMLMGNLNHYDTSCRKRKSNDRLMQLQHSLGTSLEDSQTYERNVP